MGQVGVVGVQVWLIWVEGGRHVDKYVGRYFV